MTGKGGEERYRYSHEKRRVDFDDDSSNKDTVVPWHWLDITEIREMKVEPVHRRQYAFSGVVDLYPTDFRYCMCDRSKTVEMDRNVQDCMRSLLHGGTD